MEIDLSNLAGTANTMFAANTIKQAFAFLSKQHLLINVLEDALNGTITGKVEKQCAHFFGVIILEEKHYVAPVSYTGGWFEFYQVVRPSSMLCNPFGTSF
ncbi:hypothetical protein FRX31_002580 [Thalictrum thalictroides]|uniref:Uncharacterized protein n=1 Tax=Thalictrum thalictroides TaxID=46969 RepID=A0A7J6XEA0_THATH|nr:hypothetical protein FRX31_002580 [Thalictrum thalictroides]